MNAAPGVDGHHPGPYLAWHGRHFTDEVAAAHDYVNSVIEEDGPYDGVIGFSQGAALAASLILAHQLLAAEEAPDAATKPPPFKFAVLICSVLPVAPTERLGVDATQFMLELERSLSEFLGLSEEDTERKAGPAANNKVVHVFEPVSEPGPGQALRPPQTRIKIPTLHILGAEDRFLPYGRYVVNLCEDRQAEVLVNQCGHELPRSDESLNRIAALIENIIELSKIEF